MLSVPRWFPTVTILFATSILFTHYALVPDGERSHYIDSFGLESNRILTWFAYTFLHSSNNHLLWNVIPTSVFIFFVERYAGWKTALFCISFTILLIPATFLFIEQMETASGVEAMRGHGASGIKAASGVFCTMQFIRWLSHKFYKFRSLIWWAWIILLLFCAANIWSIIYFVDTTVSDVGHITGFISGTLVFLLYQWKICPKSRTDEELGVKYEPSMQ